MSQSRTHVPCTLCHEENYLSDCVTESCSVVSRSVWSVWLRNDILNWVIFIRMNETWVEFCPSLIEGFLQLHVVVFFCVLKNAVWVLCHYNVFVVWVTSVLCLSGYWLSVSCELKSSFVSRLYNNYLHVCQLVRVCVLQGSGPWDHAAKPDFFLRGVFVNACWPQEKLGWENHPAGTLMLDKANHCRTSVLINFRKSLSKFVVGILHINQTLPLTVGNP